jgi:glycosyltransferase involved in cell wall biosynthesis
MTITTQPDLTIDCAGPAVPAPVLEVVVPVYNEQRSLERCVRTLHAHLRAEFPMPFRITIADNASTDATWVIARALGVEFDEVEVLHLDGKGRGRALDAAWSRSPADVLCYVDVDLSTDLKALARGARVVRGRKREVISRCYNLILSTFLRARFSDAQCGFKAIRADAAAELLPLVRDRSWFFDTELLVLAERAGLRIHEVPVDWVDDPDSRVDIVRTSIDDLRGCVRMKRALLFHRLPLDGIAERLGRSPARAAVAVAASRSALLQGVPR